MELMVAIIWYLNLMAPNTEYSAAEVRAVAHSNPEVMQIAEDYDKTLDIWSEFDSGWEVEIEADIIEWWEEDTSCSYELDTTPGSLLYELLEQEVDEDIGSDKGTTQNNDDDKEEESEGEKTQSQKEKTI